MTNSPEPDLSTRVDETIHELNNRLTVIAGRASLMRTIVSGSSQAEIDAIMEAVLSCQQALGDLRAGAAEARQQAGPGSEPPRVDGEDSGTNSSAA